jgi:tRNA pseudouridine13 synthase
VPALPYLAADLPGIGGVLRARDDDFAVDEELPYAPAGAGDHVFVRIEKRGIATPVAVQHVARALGVRERDVGVAGMKDRRAVTRQWLSLPPPVTPEQARALALPDVVILDAIRHPHKLRTGHVRANRFRLVVRDVGDDAVARARAILERLAAPPGAPNYFGEQRFGIAGDNAARGRAIVRGDEPPPRDRRLARLLVSAVQSELFNAWLSARIADGLFARAIGGDVMHLLRGGQFACEDPVADEPRLRAGEIVPTGPMFGARMRAPTPGSAAAAREAAILDAAGLAPDAIAEGTRRDAAIAVSEIDVAEATDRTITVCFTLPGGAYATAVMREVMKLPE